MLPLRAVVLAAPHQAPPSLAELAERPGLAATFVIRAGTGTRLHERRQLVEALWLNIAVVLLFEDPKEASEFEGMLADSEARAAHGWAPRRGRRSVGRGSSPL